MVPRGSIKYVRQAGNYRELAISERMRVTIGKNVRSERVGATSATLYYSLYYNLYLYYSF